MKKNRRQARTAADEVWSVCHGSTQSRCDRRGVIASAASSPGAVHVVRGRPRSGRVVP